MKILKAVVIQNVGTDKCILYTDLPAATWPYIDQYLTLSFEAAKDTGKFHVLNNWPDVEVEVIPRRNVA